MSPRPNCTLPPSFPPLLAWHIPASRQNHFPPKTFPVLTRPQHKLLLLTCGPSSSGSVPYTPLQQHPTSNLPHWIFLAVGCGVFPMFLRVSVCLSNSCSRAMAAGARHPPRPPLHQWPPCVCRYVKEFTVRQEYVLGRGLENSTEYVVCSNANWILHSASFIFTTDFTLPF